MLKKSINDNTQGGAYALDGVPGYPEEVLHNLPLSLNSILVFRHCLALLSHFL